MATENTLLDFQDPGKLSDELLDMPGFVNELTNYTLDQSHSPNRALAFLGATALQAHLAGRSYADTHGTRTNLYLIALGETGIGKDTPRQINRKLADAAGITASLSDAVASGEALEELIAKHPALLYQPDEAESFIGSLRGTGRNAMGLSERVRRLYSASAGLYTVRATAKSPDGTLVPYPHLTLFGTGTPQAFYDALDARSIVNGLFGRCLVVNIPDEYKANHPTEMPIPSQLTDIAAKAADMRRIRGTKAAKPHFIRERNEMILSALCELSFETMSAAPTMGCARVHQRSAACPRATPLVPTSHSACAHEPLRSCPRQRPLVGTTAPARGQPKHRLQGCRA